MFFRFPKSVPEKVKDYTWANTWGDVAVYVMLILGLATTWLYQGIDTLFVGFLFLQASDLCGYASRVAASFLTCRRQYLRCSVISGSDLQ